MDIILSFKKFELVQILSLKNAHVDALSKLANSKDLNLLKRVH